MSLPNKPSFQKPTKSSSSTSSSSSATGGAPAVRWNGNYSAGVSPVRGLSPVRSSFHGGARQDIDKARSHTNPLFSGRTSDVGRLNNTPTKAGKDCKENREKQGPWKVPTEKAQYGVKTLCTMPGKSPRTTATMLFTTPPKPVVKRKILVENRELGTGTPRMKDEEGKYSAAASSPGKEVVAESGAFPQSRNEESQCRGEDRLPSLSPERSSGEPSKPKSPLVSIEDLQKRIQKFLQDDGPAAADVSVPMSLRQSTESLRLSTESLRRSLSATATGEESSLTCVEGAPFQPLVAPYSPRPMPPVSMEGNVSPLRAEDSLIQEKTTPTYDPKKNFLSPRPQFLRYRPLRRLELLRKSAEGTLADLDLESPTTDAESSKMDSEKDEKEESDVSQEAQSSSSSLESFPRCKVSSYELFKSVEPVNGEIVQLGREEPALITSSIKTPPEAEAEANDLEVPSTRSELEDPQTEADEEELEDADSDNNSSTGWYNAFSIVTSFAITVLLVVASGSPSLLPTALHQNHVSHLWTTSRATEPIRQFLQTTEGLWTENQHLADFSLSCPDIVRVGWVHISSRIRSVDLGEVVKNGKVLWSLSTEYSARLGRLTKESFLNLKASLEEERSFYRSQGQQEENEWDWVPDYEFVVPRDMFDTGEAYAIIMARLESWKIKPFGSSPMQSYSKHHPSTDDNMDKSMESGNSSQCVLPVSPEYQSVLPFRPATALGSQVIVDIPVSQPRPDIELNSNVSDESDEGTSTNPEELNAESGGVDEGSLLSVQADYQELEVGNVLTDLRAPNVVTARPENAADAIVDVQPFPLPAEEKTPLSSGVDVVQLSPNAEEIQQASVVEDVPVLDSISGQFQPPSLPNSFQEESSVRQGVAEPFQVPSSPEENDIDSFRPQEPKPETPRSRILEKLMHVACLRTTAAFATSSLLAASVVLALLALRRINVHSGKGGRPANLKASSAQRFSEPSCEPQFNEADRFQPFDDIMGNDFLVEDSSALELAADQLKRFSTPYPVSVETPNRTARKVMGNEVTPEKSFKHITDQDTLRSPDTSSPGVTGDSSLGRFMTMVPVVHNEGTARERVQLTPVRRSSRIRTRMQNSPCTLMHSPHLCNC